ncbi:MAG: glycosyltransferase [Gloeobacteraceae cyanobacterium ES-bin-144]|nr:glycosyltransferase [Verrucomicrobiales bacterium]
MPFVLSIKQLKVTIRRKMLFLSPCTPDPQGTGWEQRAYSFLFAYSRFMDVALWFVPTQDNPDLVRSPSLPTICKSMTAFHTCAFNDPRSGLMNRFRRDLSRSELVHIFRFEEFVRVVNHQCIAWDIDELPWHLRPSGWDGKMNPAPNETTELIRTTFASDANKCKRIFGSSILERPENCTKFTAIPNIIRFPKLPADDPAARNPSLLFVGNLNFSPNTDGLLFFHDQILPILDSLMSGISISIVGRAPDTEVARSVMTRLHQSKRYRLAFDVPNCSPYYHQATVAIAPILSGGGTRIKIIEAFANRCPVISTTRGCEGLNVEHGKQLLIADRPQDFANACVELLRNAPLRNQMMESAFAFSEREHSQEIVEKLLRSSVASLLET